MYPDIAANIEEFDSAVAKPVAGAFPGWPRFEDDEIEAVARVLRSGKVNYWTGEEAKRFEGEFADYVGVSHAVSLANGTVALELALHALGIGPGDEVIVPARTFIATASAVFVRGARPVIADIDPESQNLTAETIAPQITPRTRAIIPVHFAGWPCDMEPILELAARSRIKVIEDCAQAHGARYRGRPVGSFGDAAAFSFCQDKILTTGGEGGMLLIRDHAVWRRAWEYKDHGKNYDRATAPAGLPGFRPVHDTFGTNWRMTEMQAAIGRVQLRKLDSWVTARRENTGVFRSALQDLVALRIPVPAPDVYHSYYKLYAFVRPDALRTGWTRDRIVREISNAGTPCSTGGSPEIYLEKAFQDAGLAPSERLPNARHLGEISLMFLVHPTLTRSHLKRMASCASAVLDEATG
jgi:dTDP-4-amino-4,6-dideoxygalactose transaminase